LFPLSSTFDSLSFSRRPRPPRAPLFPYTTLFRSTIKGLKKGTIYLKKEQDTAIVTVDSVIINGIPDFELHSNIESPEIFYLYLEDRKSTRLNSSHVKISYAVFCLKKKNVMNRPTP